MLTVLPRAKEDPDCNYAFRLTPYRRYSSSHTGLVIRDIGGQICSKVFERCLICCHNRAGIIRRGCWVIPGCGGLLEKDFEQGLRDCHLIINIGADDLFGGTHVVVVGLSVRMFSECLPEEDKSFEGGILRLDGLAELHIRKCIDDITEIANLLLVAVVVPFFCGNECNACG